MSPASLTPLRRLDGSHADASLDDTFGAVLLGTFFALMLYGVTLQQAYRYHVLYPSDRLLLKFAVGTLDSVPRDCLNLILYLVMLLQVYATVILETVHMAFSCHTSYYYLVIGFADPSILQHPVHFFAHRAYVFGKRFRVWVSLAILFLMGEFGVHVWIDDTHAHLPVSAGFCVASSLMKAFTPFARISLSDRGFSAFVRYTWIIATASAMAVCADGILTTVLIMALLQGRSSLKRTNSTLDVLVLYTITTGEFVEVRFPSYLTFPLGLLTSVSMLLLFVFVVLRPADLIYTGVSLVSTKLYANMLLAALNSRQSLRDQVNLNIGGTEIFGTHVQQSRTPFDQSVAIELPDISDQPGDDDGFRLSTVEIEDHGSNFSCKDAVDVEARYSPKPEPGSPCHSA
ncbi:hypothetical protein BD311DRAFT_778854 [Dichomitus squalens]|uniref:DUF6534 domain-containing protein n=1 Tax=Dichomitus squalens TaxID=114155 RepID=A0A4Q9MKX2_9APHY|nr:hypothetical protein BD311DRAFT_778854 [Dichomitus squalens]